MIPKNNNTKSGAIKKEKIIIINFAPLPKHFQELVNCLELQTKLDLKIINLQLIITKTELITSLKDVFSDLQSYEHLINTIEKNIQLCANLNLQPLIKDLRFLKKDMSERYNQLNPKTENHEGLFGNGRLQFVKSPIIFKRKSSLELSKNIDSLEKLTSSLKDHQSWNDANLSLESLIFDFLLLYHDVQALATLIGSYHSERKVNVIFSENLKKSQKKEELNRENIMLHKGMVKYTNEYTVELESLGEIYRRLLLILDRLNKSSYSQIKALELVPKHQSPALNFIEEPIDLCDFLKDDNMELSASSSRPSQSSEFRGIFEKVDDTISDSECLFSFREEPIDIENYQRFFSSDSDDSPSVQNN